MPKKFIDLLSDDKINREVLTWCKSWDEFVFKIKRVHSDRKKVINKKPELEVYLHSNKNKLFLRVNL